MNLVIKFFMSVIGFWVLLSAVFSGIYGFQTGDYKPLADDTIGRIVGADNRISEDIDMLNNNTFVSENQNLDNETFVEKIIFSLPIEIKNAYKKDIIISLITIVFMVIGLYWIFSILFFKTDNYPLFNKAMFFVVSLFVIFGLMGLYNILSGNVGIPGSGIIKLITNFNVVFGSGI